MTSFYRSTTCDPCCTENGFEDVRMANTLDVFGKTFEISLSWETSKRLPGASFSVCIFNRRLRIDVKNPRRPLCVTQLHIVSSVFAVKILPSMEGEKRPKKKTQKRRILKCSDQKRLFYFLPDD